MFPVHAFFLDLQASQARVTFRDFRCRVSGVEREATEEGVPPEARIASGC